MPSATPIWQPDHSFNVNVGSVYTMPGQIGLEGVNRLNCIMFEFSHL
jgi:hypothetical protein